MKLLTIIFSFDLALHAPSNVTVIILVTTCRLLPEMVATLLSDSLNRERVLSLNDASHVLRNAFYQTEACMNHSYEVSSPFLFIVYCLLFHCTVYILLSSVAYKLSICIWFYWLVVSRTFHDKAGYSWLEPPLWIVEREGFFPTIVVTYLLLGYLFLLASYCYLLFISYRVVQQLCFSFGLMVKEVFMLSVQMLATQLVS